MRILAGTGGRILAITGILAISGILACRITINQPVPPTVEPTQRAVSTVQSTTPRAGEVSTQPDETVTVTALQTLNVRQYPGTGSQGVGILHTGEIVTVTGKPCEGDWIEIKYHWDTGDDVGETAWINSQYVTKGACE